MSDLVTNIMRDFDAAQSYAAAEMSMLQRAVAEKWDGELYHLAVTYGETKAREIMQMRRDLQAFNNRHAHRVAIAQLEG
ncbi:MAG: hypothetical protein K2Q12_08185 [Rickettsiales bacterium]|nr:hypothetical protein [Rickettsiales bacterium]